MVEKRTPGLCGWLLCSLLAGCGSTESGTDSGQSAIGTEPDGQVATSGGDGGRQTAATNDANGTGSSEGGASDGNGPGNSEGGTNGSDGGNGGNESSGSDGGGSSGEIPDGQVPGIVGVGYGGLRVVSRDDGQSWGDRAVLTNGNNNDDVELLRGIAWGNGVWIATGWKILRSTDGVNWTEDTEADADLTDLGCGLMESIVYGKGKFVGACGLSTYLSTDGHTWTKGGDVGAVGGHTRLIFGDGKFGASGDTNSSFVSDDGITWGPLTGVSSVRFCDDDFVSFSACHGAKWLASGTWITVDWGGKIKRSTSGTFGGTYVYSDANGNSFYNADAFAEGYVAP